jgi:hypothetical protein
MSQAFFEKCGFDSFSALVLEDEAKDLGLDFKYLGPVNTMREFTADMEDDPELTARFEFEVVVEYRGVQIKAKGRTPRTAIGMIFNAARK